MLEKYKNDIIHINKTAKNTDLYIGHSILIFSLK